MQVSRLSSLLRTGNAALFELPAWLANPATELLRAVVMEIASRTLTLRNGKTEIAIPIRLFAPQQHSAGDWFCRYEIDWPEGKKGRDAWGSDSFQAIILTLQAIGTDIYSSTYHKSGNLFFEAPGRGYGFPVPVTLRDLLIGDDAKY